MYKQLMLSLSLLKGKYIYVIFILASFLFTLLSSTNEHGTITRSDDVIITMSFAETIATATFIMILMLFFNKEYKLSQLKMNEWYYTQPFSTKDLIAGDLLFIILTHLVSYLYWIIFNIVNQSPEKFNIMLMVTAVSLVLHAVYLLLLYKKDNLLNKTAYIFYMISVIVTYCFHGMIVRNDYEMVLNLSRMSDWHFYLYQLPYLTLTVGVILIVVFYLVAMKQFNRKHHLA